MISVPFTACCFSHFLPLLPVVHIHSDLHCLSLVALQNFIILYALAILSPCTCHYMCLGYEHSLIKHLLNKKIINAFDVAALGAEQK